MLGFGKKAAASIVADNANVKEAEIKVKEEWHEEMSDPREMMKIVNNTVEGYFDSNQSFMAVIMFHGPKRVMSVNIVEMHGDDD